MNLTWALHRLSAMSGREIAFRVGRQVRTQIEKSGVLDVPPPPPERRPDGRAWVSTWPVDLDVEKYRAAADLILDGRFRVFALSAAPLGFPPDWNCDPKTGTRAPQVYGKTLDYRDESLVGDIKYLWEPSRHSELVTLAQAWRLTGEARYAEGVRTLVDAWIEQCPYPLGPHWSSSLEHAVRLIHWSFAWRLLGGEESFLFQSADAAAFRARWLASIYRHCQFIDSHLSRFSSANNHLLGELAGLFIAATTWPRWVRSERWRSQSLREFEREALRQNGPDGVNREQANWYHHEVADMLLLVGLAARANGGDLSAQYWERLRAMLDYVASIMDAGGAVPNFGDADDAVIARLDPDANCNVYRSLLAAGAVVFDSPALALKANAFDDKSRWLLGDSAAAKFATLARTPTPADIPMRRRFEDAGYYILGDGFETPAEVRIVADAGPLGYLSIAAHGHADALSFTLSAGGRELLIDPGTFAYHTQQRWRDYFRGTSAHNTVRIDREDQSVSGGNFMWRRHARARVLEFDCKERLQRLLAEHDGYARLDDPVRHRRELSFERMAAHGETATATLRVTDEIACRGAHAVELFWHFSEQCQVERIGPAIVVRNGLAQLTLRMPSQMQVDVLRGVETPPLGWVSRAFDTRTPTATVRGVCRIEGDARLETAIEIETREPMRPLRRPDVELEAE